MEVELGKMLIHLARVSIASLPDLEGSIPLREIESALIIHDLLRVKKEISDYIEPPVEVEHLVGGLYELGSILFCLGAEPSKWKTLLQRVGESYYSMENPNFLPLCVIGGDTSFVERRNWMEKAIQNDRIDFRGTLAILLQDPALLYSKGAEDEYDNNFGNVCSSLLQGDLGSSARGIRSIASFWMEEDPNWKRYESGFFPMFEPYPCALAAIYKGMGGDVSVFSSDERQFLASGLIG